MPLLTVNKFNKRFGKEQVVKDVSFQLEKASCTALIGPNGAGKTTILNMMTQLLNKTSGDLVFHHDNQTDIRKLIGYLPQNPVFYSWMTGKEFLVFSGRLTNLSKEKAHKEAARLLERVDLYEAKDKKISTYSGGMKQRLGIAQALIHKPKLVLLDEPVSALDPIGRRDVLTLMEELKKEITILYSTHILSDAEEVSDRILLLNKGELIESGSIEDLRQKYRTNAIELSFSGELDLIIPLLESIKKIKSITIENKKVIIMADHIEDTRTEIISLILENNLPLLKFSISQISLEQMFMEVVTR